MAHRSNPTRLVKSLGVLLAAVASVAAARVGTVLRVVDGDTMLVEFDGQATFVRLYGIYAPEHNQPGGDEARFALRRLVDDAQVKIIPISDGDRLATREIAARVFRGRLDINAEMIRQGYAWVYRDNLRYQDRAWCSLEAEARRLRRGLWAKLDPIPPWNYSRHVMDPSVPPCP